MVHFYLRVTIFLVGVFLGVLLAIKCRYYLDTYGKLNVPAKRYIPSYRTWFDSQRLKRAEVLWDTLRYENHNFFLESHFLHSKIKIVCVLLVRRPSNIRASKDTWGMGCDNITIIEVGKKSSKGIPAKRSKENSSWILLCKILQGISTEYDWILVVNDSTFVILENLRYYLASLRSSEKYYLGHAVKFWNTVYNSGEAGYVLSKGTVQAFKEKYSATGCSSNTYWNREDFYLGKHLSSLNITPIDTRDSEGLSTFHPYNWYHVFFPGENYYKTSVFPIKCCSKYSIAFQAIEGDKMYTYYYLLYILQIFWKGKLGNRPPSKAVSEEGVWKQFLRERDIIDDNITSDQYYKLWENLVDDPNSFAARMKKEVGSDYD